MKRVVWKETALVLLELEAGRYTIGQMLRDPYMLFFRTEREDGDFSGLDLNEVPALFIVPVARDFLQKRGVKKIEKGVEPRRDVEVPERWLQAKLGPPGGYVWKGGDLVRIDPEVGDAGMANEVLKRDLDPHDPEDRRIIEEHELTNVLADHPLTQRLILSLEEGENVDPLKQKVFFGEDPYGVID